MPLISRVQLKNFIKKSIVVFDIYDSFNNVAYLKDNMGSTIASVDYETNISLCESEVYIDDHTPVSLTEEHTGVVFEYIDTQTAEARAYKLKLEKEAYDVKFERGLFNYGY